MRSLWPREVATRRCSSCRRRDSKKRRIWMSSVKPLPPGFSSMWRALKRAHEAEPALLGVSFTLAMLAALPDALLALWIKLLADGLLKGDRKLLAVSAIGLGISAS